MERAWVVLTAMHSAWRLFLRPSSPWPLCQQQFSMLSPPSLLQIIGGFFLGFTVGGRFDMCSNAWAGVITH